MGVGRARPSAISVVEIALDGLVGEVVEGTGLALDGVSAVGQISILQSERLEVYGSERMMAGPHVAGVCLITPSSSRTEAGSRVGILCPGLRVTLRSSRRVGSANTFCWALR